MRRLFRITGWTLGVLLLLLLAAVSALHAPSARTAVLKEIQGLLRESDIDLRVRRFDYNLFQLKAWITGLEIRAARQPDLRPVFSASGAELSIRWRTIWSGEIDIERLHVHRPAIAIFTDSTGASNLPKPPPDDDAPSELPVWNIDDLRFSQGSFSYRDETLDAEASIPDWRLTLARRDLDFAALRPGLIRFANDQVTLAKLELRGMIDPEALLFEQARLLAEVDLQPFTPGSLSLIATAAGPQLEAQLNGNGFDLTLAGAARMSLDEERVHITSLHVQSPFGTLDAQGSAALNEAAGQSAFTAKAILDRQLPLKTRALIAAEAAFPALDFEKAEARAWLTADIREFEGVRLSGQASMDSARRLGGTFLLDVPSLDAVDSSLRGDARLQARLTGTVEDPRLQGSLEGRHLGAGPVENASLDATLAASLRAIEVPELLLAWRNQLVRGNGVLNLEKTTPELLFEAKSDNFALENTLPGLDVHDLPVRGAFDLALHAEGPIDQIAATASLHATGLEAYKEPLGAFTLNAAFLNNRLILNEARLDKPGSEPLVLEGEFDLAAQAYHFALRAPSLRLENLELPENLPVRAVLALNAEGTGTIEEPALQLSASAASLLVNDIDLGAIDASARLANREVNVDLDAPRFALRGHLRAGIDAPFLSSFTIDSAGTDLAVLPLPEDLPLAGKIRAALTGAGPLESPEKLNARLTLEPESLSYQGEPITTEGPVDLELADFRLRVHQADIRAAGAQLSLSGEFPLEEKAAPGDMRLTATADLSALPKFVPDWPDTQQIAGQIAVNGAVHGTLEKPVPELTAALTGGRFASDGLNPVTDLSLEISLRDNLIQLTRLAGEWAGATLSGTASSPFPLTKQGPPAKAEIAITGLNPARIQGAPEMTSGLVSLRLTAEAAAPEIAAVRAALTFDELRLSISDIPVAQQSPSTLRLDRGQVTVDQFTLTGPGTELRLTGSATLLDQPAADFRLAGRLETGLLAALLAPLRLRGPASLDFTAAGPLDNLKTAGFLELTGLEMNLPEPRLAAEAVNARLDFDGDRVRLTRLDGLLNGGKLSGSGATQLKDGSLGETDLQLNATGVYLDYPADFRTVSNTALRFRTEGQGFLLSGNIDIVEGAFRELLTLEGGLLAYLNSGQGVDLTEDRNELIDRTRLDLNLKTTSPLLINNNLARAEVNTNLRVVGTPYRPSLLGRIEIEEGGELYLAERTYPIERGRITFTNEQRIEPSLDVLARTRAGGLDITLQVEGGGAERLETRLTSDPPEPEPDIIAVLITGRPLEEIRGSDASTLASRQVLSYLAGNLGGRFTREIERATGLSKVRVEPDLIAAESNPTARLTVGQDITRDARLIYSMNLANGGDQVWVAEYDLTRRFITRGVKQVDNTYRFEFRHDIRFGGDPDQRRQQRVERRVGEVAISGNSLFPDDRLRKRLKARPGRRYDFFNIRQGLDRISKDYDKQDRLEARLRLERTERDGEVDLSLAVEEGPRVLLHYEGYQPSRKTRRQIRELWRDGVFDGQRLDETASFLRETLVRRRHFEAVVEAEVKETEPGLRTVIFRAEPGVRYGKPEILFEGNTAFSAKELAAAIDKSKHRPILFLEPRRVTDLVRGVYRERGYLDTATPAPRVEFDRAAARATVTVPIEEGPAFSVGEIRLAGNQALKSGSLVEKMPLRGGSSYTPALRQEALDRVLDAYQSSGYTAAQVETRVVRAAEPGRVDLEVVIDEGPQQVVESIEVEGERAVSERLIHSQLALKPGDTVDPSKVSLSRRRLYATGAFALVDIERIPVSSGAAPVSGQQPIRLRARVREVQPFDLRYGAYFDTDRGPGAVVDVTNRNSLGSARTFGLRGRLDGEIRETRFFFSQPLLQRLPLQTLATTYFRREILPDFINDRAGVSAQQELRFRQRYTMNYGYRLENVHTYDRVPDPFFPFDISLRVAPLTWTLNRESRDDLLDATRGSFTSHSLEYAPAGLGSQLNFIRYYGQLFKYIPLTKPSEVPLGGGIQRSRFVYAGAIRTGLARGLRGQELVRSERFFTGGGTTLRGFALNAVGPTDFFGDATGGNALLLINNELRFPLVSLFEGVGFSDIGNVFPSARDLSLRDIRKTAGAGLRVRTPYFLLRFDYGFILDRRPGEPRGGFFFSIGQAF